MSDHTPLPWKATGTKALGLAEIIAPDATFEQGHLVCVMAKRFYRDGTDERRHPRELVEANARLIETAVNSHYELVEALKRIMHYAGIGASVSDVDTQEQPEFVNARKALAKAKAD